jgi:hypothetical protein
VSTKPTPCRQPSDRYLKAEMTENFQRSPFRDAALELIAIAPRAPRHGSHLETAVPAWNNSGLV